MRHALSACVAVGLAFTSAQSVLARAGADDKAATPAPAPAAAPPKAETPLPTDPRFVRGTLDNGMSYIVLKHSNPPNRANMWIHISSGSLNETEKQRGLAHYLEHMAFNGSENFPPGSVVDFFQSMGLRFGQDQNAFTSFDQTTYQLAFPDTKPETLERGMRFFGDVAHRLTLSPEEIDKERQIIMEEKRRSLGAQQRITEYMLERIAPESIIGRRLPIGTEQTIMGMQRADFEDYYSRWYVPSNMTIIVVADTDPAVVVEQIKKSFSGGEKKPKPQDNPIGVKPYDSTRAIVAHDAEITEASVAITRIDKPLAPVTTVGGLRENIVDDLASSAFNRRIGAKIAKGGTTYTDANASASNMFNALFMKQVEASGKPESWQAMMGEISEDAQRARLHGFTAREIADVKAQMISSAEQLVQQESTLPVRAVIGRINRDVAVGDTTMSASQELDLLNQILPTITAEEVSARFAQLFDPASVTFVVTLPDNVPGGIPTEQQVIDLGRKALDVKPAPMSEDARPTSLLARKPEPGKIVEQSEFAPAAVATAVFENGVIVHHRFMDIRKDEVTVSINLAAGSIQETAATRGVSDVASLAWDQKATSTLTSTNIRDLMVGKKSRVRGGIGGDLASLTVAGSPDDLEVGMQLAYLLLTDPKIEPSAFDQWKIKTLQGIEERTKNPQGVFAEAMAATIYPTSDARTQPLTADQVNKLTVEAGQAWLNNAIKTAPIEVTIVGDISKERALELSRSYLGALSKRDRITGQTLSGLRSLPRTKGPVHTERTLQTQTPVAVVAAGFYACDQDQVSDRRNLQMASRILNTRMTKKIREEEQLAYSPGTALRPGVEFPGFGTFAAISPTEPSKAKRLGEAFMEVYDEFAKSGPTAEEMDTARKQLANTLDEQFKEPGFWTGQTATMIYRRAKLEDVMSAQDYYKNLAADSVRDTFRKYYTPENTMKITVKPEASTDAKAQAPAAK